MTEPLRVLIVEDRASDAELMVLRLADDGFDPEWVRVETEAEFLVALDAAPNLILCDWSLPTFSGLKALQVVRERGLDIPLLIVSGSVGEEAAIEALHQGADDYVLKDRPARLGAAVRRALEAKRLRDEHRLADAALRQAAMVFESSTQGVTVTDVDGTILTVNAAFTAITGYAADEVIGKNHRVLASGRHDESFYRDLWATVLSTGRWRGELWNRRKDGEIYPEWLTISAVKGEDGRTTHFVGVFSDVGDVKRTQQQLDFLAHHDALTGLPNRTLLHDRLEQALRRAHEWSRMVGVLALDIDRFGRVNDGLGHGIGDGLLQAIARRIGDQLGADDSMARFGGDEFVVVVGEARSAANVARVTREYLDRLAEPFNIGGQQVVVTCCAGVSLYPTDGTDAATLLHHAVAALRQAKVRGPNTMAFVDVGLAAGLEHGVELERLLRGAAARHELVVHYQPQVELAGRSLVGAEALVRWQRPERALVPPGEFVPLAEELGIIGEIDEWVLTEACRQLAAWQADGLLVARVAVNLSAQELEREDFASSVKAALEAADVAPERLELEVTESMLMHDSRAVSKVVGDLGVLGVDLAMDDFGTGQSSLAQLRRLPLRRLKIDMSFVSDIGRDAAAEAIIRAIIAMAGSLGLQTVAEGVEREDQAAFLRDAGCDIGQGFLFGRPMPADAFQAAWGEG